MEGERAKATTASAADANAAGFDAGVDDVFARIAGRYDLLCDIFSLGLHRGWKARVARHIVSAEWQSMLDAAAGTGHIIRRVVARRPGIDRTRRIIVSDISAPMLAIAQKATAATAPALDFRILDAHAMPSIADGSIDLYSMSLGLKICDRHRALAEAFRVLTPGGRIVVLEASAIRSRWLHRLYLVYMDWCMPLIGRIATTTVLNGENFGSVTLFRAYPDGVDTWSIVEKERSDPAYREQLLAHNEYNRRIYDYVHRESMEGRGVMISLTANYRHTEYGEPMVALKSFITSPFVNEEGVELVVQKVLEAREKVGTGGR